MWLSLRSRPPFRADAETELLRIPMPLRFEVHVAPWLRE